MSILSSVPGNDLPSISIEVDVQVKSTDDPVSQIGSSTSHDK